MGSIGSGAQIRRNVGRAAGSPCTDQQHPCKTWIVNNELSNAEKWAQADFKEFIL